MARVLRLVLPAFALVAACGGSDNGNDPAQFIGTWVATDGELKITCPIPVAIPAQSLKGESLTITAGTDAPVITTVRDCTIKFDVSGKVATAKPGQSCMTTYAAGSISLAATLTVASAVLSIDGATGTFNQNGMATLSQAIPGVPANGCAYQMNATATKNPATDAKAP